MKVKAIIAYLYMTVIFGFCLANIQKGDESVAMVRTVSVWNRWNCVQ